MRASKSNSIFPLISYQPLSDWNTGNVLRMNHMFYKAEAFNQDISGWDVDQVTNFNNFLRGANINEWPMPALSE